MQVGITGAGSEALRGGGPGPGHVSAPERVGDPARGSSLGARLAAACLGLAALATLGASAGLSVLGAGLRHAWGDRYPLVLALAVLSGAISLRALVLAVPGARGGAGLSLAHVRLALVVAVAALAVHLVWLQPFRVEVALATLALAGGVHGSAALWIAGRPRRPRPLGRGLEVLAFSLAVTLLGGELALRALAARVPHPLLVASQGDARSFLAAWRMVPGELRYRFPVNSRGDFDYEWTGRRPGQKLVVTIGDSFSTSTGPQPLHFTSVAERLLEDVEVYNMGAPAIGPPEYLLLLGEDALPMQPDLVIVNLFVGNDLVFRGPKPLDVPWMRAWMDADEVVLARALRRGLAIRAERVRQGGAPVGVAQGSVDTAPAGEGAGGRPAYVLTVEEAHQTFPYTLDPDLEKPTFSAEEFLRIQASRVLVCDLDRPAYAALEAILDRMRVAVGRVPLAILLIPDEFQIEDALWETVTALHPGVRFDRFLPQRRLRAYCEAHGIDLVDTTEALLAVSPDDLGRRRLYHLRDTHWNARGSAIAGQVLGEYLRGRLGR